MSNQMVLLRELNAWGFDRYDYRPEIVDQASLSRANALIADRPSLEQCNPVVDPTPQALDDIFRLHETRPDLLAEMDGLSWTLGMVDLRALIAFQRRLAFSAHIAAVPVSSAEDWPALVALCFPAPKPVEFKLTRECKNQSVILQSCNPNLHIRITKDPVAPLTIHAGGPFFEVASFRGRWFLRDGYHRAYAMLRSGVFAVPAVIVRAATIEDLGANQPWFFPEEILFSAHPPLVADFLNEDLVLEYERPPFVKTIRITIEEDLQPAPTGEAS